MRRATMVTCRGDELLWDFNAREGYSVSDEKTLLGLESGLPQSSLGILSKENFFAKLLKLQLAIFGPSFIHS
jgi:hypothetical protein